MTVDIGTSGEPPLAAPAAEAAASWFLRQQDGPITAAEQDAFQQWLDSSEKHREEYGYIQRLWGSLDGLAPRRGSRRRIRKAACLVAGIGVALAIGNSLAVKQERIHTARGETSYVRLADGSGIAADSDTALRIEYSLFQRKLFLEKGQVFIDVAADLRPLTVEAGNGRMRDIGTRFNVRYDGNAVFLAVAEGMVEAALADGSQRARVRAGQQLTFGNGPLATPRAVSPEAADAWRKERWVFEGAPLTEVVSLMNQSHDRQVVLADTSLENYRISGVFRRDDRAALLAALCSLLPLHAVETREGTRLQQR